MSSYAFVPLSDEVLLIDRCRRRENGAYEEFCSKFRSTIRRVAVRMLKDESAAEDAVQETLLNVYRAIGRFRGEARISTWLNRITTNVCLEMLRRSGKRKEESFEELQETLVDTLRNEDSPFDHLYHKELGDRLNDTLSRVSAKQGQIVKMHDWEGLTIGEIAKRLNISEGTVKSRLFYGRHECRRHLSRVHGDTGRVQ
jgi:RNA polymerase sigma-70 factor (ECF subfamily)